MAITLADFTKIWASTSPLTPYSFSDSNYQEGWNFVGTTPPARQMWDSIQKQNDEKMEYIVNNFLPLRNGDLTWNGKNLDHVVDYSIFKTAEQFTAPSIIQSRIKDVGGGYKKVGNVVYVYVRFKMNTTLTKGGWGILGDFPAPYNMGFIADYRIPLIATGWCGDAYSGNVSSAFIDSDGTMRLITNATLDPITSSQYYIYAYGNYYAE